jgi:undecaprenyl diphosphate synthase
MGDFHVGLIPDGNRRFAQENNISYKSAYERSRDKLLDFVDVTIQNEGVSELSLYLLSEENLDRSDDELQTTYDVFLDEVPGLTDRFGGRGLDMRWISTKPDALPEDVQAQLETIETDFDGDGLKVNLLFSYSGRKEIVEACQRICKSGVSDIDAGVVTDNLQIKNEVDFVIRSGDNPRRECLSGFPIWQSSYSEYHHIPQNFPAIPFDDIVQALGYFDQKRLKRGR